MKPAAALTIVPESFPPKPSRRTAPVAGRPAVSSPTPLPGSLGLASKERRGALRLTSHLDGDCRPASGAGADSWPACTADISESGLGLLVSRRFERGTVLALTLSRGRAEKVCMPLARVLSVHASGFQWKLGCAWASTLSRAELVYLLGSEAVQRAGIVARTECLLWLAGSTAP